MRKLNVGVIGLGFIGNVHLDAIARSPYACVSAICDSNPEYCNMAAERFDTADCYKNYYEVLEDPKIDVIHICVPNNLHFEIIQEAFRQKKHILCEKPLGVNAEETEEIVEMARLHPNIKTAVNFNYRMYPMVQECKEEIASGDAGIPTLVHGRFLQDWLLYDTDYSWRLEPKMSGETRAIGDIGSHWCDLAETIIGSRITTVMADLATVVPIRKRPLGQVKTFSTEKNDSFEEFQVTSDDYGCVMLRFENGTKGVFLVSQVSAGHKCALEIEVNTTKMSFAWSHEDSEKLWCGHRDAPNAVAIRDPAILQYMGECSSLPAGHPQGFYDAVLNNFNAFYKHILFRTDKATCQFADFEAGHHIMCVVSAIVQSAKTHSWVNVEL